MISRCFIEELTNREYFLWLPTNNFNYKEIRVDNIVDGLRCLK